MAYPFLTTTQSASYGLLRGERRQVLSKRLNNLIEKAVEYARSVRVAVLALLFLVAIIFSLWSVSRTHRGWEALALNLGTEMIGAVVIYILLELFIGGRDKKADLIARLGSRVLDTTMTASEGLRRHSWLSDGSLEGANLNGANLRGADLSLANLQNASLQHANLQGANLDGADLRGADLFRADLEGASLSAQLGDRGSYKNPTNLEGANLAWAMLEGATLKMANLQGANLRAIRAREANLSGVNLQRANLEEANLLGADLRGADLQSANLARADIRVTLLDWGTLKVDENTTFPDDKKWTPDMNVAHYWFPEYDFGLYSYYKHADAHEVVLTMFVGRRDLPLPDLILKALRRLPETGPIRDREPKRVIKAISAHIKQVPDSHPHKREMVRLYNGALIRWEKGKTTF